MKKAMKYKGFIIAVNNHDEYFVFTKDEWIMGKDLRYPEWENAGTIQECIDFIDSY